jgi:hypothetical protein
LARWTDYLHDLGDAEVKHGVHVHVFNLYGDDFGNPAIPTKFSATIRPPVYKRTLVIAAVTLMILALVVAGIWYAVGRRAKTLSQPTPEVTVVAGPEQSLNYWLTVQKMLNNKPLGAPIDSAGDISFGNGWKFKFNVRPSQPGALYLLNVGPGKNGADEYDILFPLPREGRLDPKLVGNQAMQSDWYRFVEKTGVEKLWIIWSADPLPDLDAIFGEAVRDKKDPGVISRADQIAQIDAYLKKYDSAHLEVTADKSKKTTSVKGHGDILVSLVQLSHEAY